MQDFQEKDFYTEPPARDADPQQWVDWMETEKHQRAAHKRSYTMSFDHAEVPEQAQESTLRKVAGRWSQSVAVGISGSETDGYSLEPVSPENQNREIILATWQKNRRGTKSKARNQRRRAAKRRAKK